VIFAYFSEFSFRKPRDHSFKFPREGRGYAITLSYPKQEDGSEGDIDKTEKIKIGFNQIIV